MAKNKDVVAIIPARYASIRVPAKPLIDLCGKSMIQRVYEQTKKASLVSRVIVATDHKKIAEAVKRFGGEVVMTPIDIKSGSDRIAYVTKSLPEANIIVNVQGDEPLIDPEMINQAVEPLIIDPAIQISTLIKKITSADELINPNIAKVVIDSLGYAVYFSRSPIPCLRDETDMNKWLANHAYFKHIGVYVFRRERLLEFASWRESPLEKAEKLEQLRIIEHGFKIKAIITEYDSISIDTSEDINRVVKLLKQKGVQQ